MDVFKIQGGQRLTGKISVDGSKNAALPLLAASLAYGRVAQILNSIEILLGIMGKSPRLYIEKNGIYEFRRNFTDGKSPRDVGDIALMTRAPINDE